MAPGSQSLIQVSLPLVPRANRSITTDELIKKLTSLFNQLSDAQQDNVALKAQLEKTIAPQLVDKNLTQHKDRGVRSYAAVCIVEVLRICAPEAPFTSPQLKDAFELFLKQFKSLESPDDAYFSNAMHLLKVLETTKCIVIISDLGNSSTNLISSYFKTFFDLCSPTLNKDIEHMMSSILSHIIDEGEGLPAPAMEIILAQFIRKHPSKEKKKDQTELTSLGIGGYPAAYIMAKGLCQDCADHLARDICTYFSDVLLPDSPDDEIDIEDLEKAHFLINELYLASPHMLSNTIPLLEAELHTEHSEVRSMAVECVGRMAGARSASANFTVLYAACWNAWVARRNDKNPNVRVKWIEALPDILAHNPDVVEDISGKLNELLMSPDDKVRLAAVKVFSTLSYNLLLSSIGKQSLEALADRCKDRKNTIRIEAMQVLARMWSLAYHDIASGHMAATETFSWIPSALILTMYTNDRDLTSILYKVLYTVLIPFNITDDMLRTKRLLLFTSQLGEKSHRALQTLPLRQLQSEQYVLAYLDAAEKLNGGEIAENKDDVTRRFDAVCTSVAALLGMPESSAQRKADLKKWGEQNDRRGFKLFRDLINPEKDFKTLRKTQKELLSRIEEASPSLTTVFTSFIQQCTLQLWNKTTLECLITALSDVEVPSASKAVAHDLIKQLSLSHPKIFKNLVPTLAEWIIERAERVSPDNSIEDKLAVEDVLKAVSRLHGVDLPGKLGKDFVNALKTLALEGDTERQGRRATTILLNMQKRNLYAEDLVDRIVPSLTFGDKSFVNRLGSLSKLMILASDKVEKHADAIIDKCIKDILMKNREANDGEEEWVKDTELGVECRAKMLALKILANRLRANIDPDAAASVAGPVLRLLGTLVQGGELRAEGDTPLSTRARLRLRAGLIVIKLCTTRLPNGQNVYERMFTPTSFNMISLLPQDDCPEVRHGFLEALKKGLQSNSLAPRWYTLCFLAAFEPSEQFKGDMVRWLKNRALEFRAKKVLLLERTFPRLLHLLSHHSDFDTKESDLDDLSTYITFYLDCVGTADNYALFFHLAQRVKQARDALDIDKSENMYVLSDLAQEIIKLLAAANDWVLVTHPQKEKLPSELFSALPSQKISRKQYLPTQFAEALPSKLKRGTRHVPRKPKPLKPTMKQNRPPKSPKSPPSPTSKKRAAMKAKKPTTIKKPRVSAENVGERRTSGRHRGNAKYTEAGDSTDDEKMLVENMSGGEDMEEVES